MCKNANVNILPIKQHKYDLSSNLIFNVLYLLFFLQFIFLTMEFFVKKKDITVIN